MSDTASIARQVVESGDVSNNDDTNASNTLDHADVAGQEYDALLGENPSSTRKIAAAMHVIEDRRPYVSTKQGQVRRQFEDDGNETRRIAREAVDGQSWGEAAQAELSDDDKKAIARDKATMNAQSFAADVNRSTMEGTLPTNASTDAIVRAIIARRNAK